MNKKSIHEAIEFILASLEAQGQASGTLKNYQNSFNVFEKYLKEHEITHVNQDVCLEYVYSKSTMWIAFCINPITPTLVTEWRIGNYIVKVFN